MKLKSLAALALSAVLLLSGCAAPASSVPPAATAAPTSPNFTTVPAGSIAYSGDDFGVLFSSAIMILS